MNEDIQFRNSLPFLKFFLFSKINETKRKKRSLKNKIVCFRNMFLSSASSNLNVIQPLPRFYTIRFGRRTEIDDDDDQKKPEFKINEVNRILL